MGLEHATKYDLQANSSLRRRRFYYPVGTYNLLDRVLSLATLSLATNSCYNFFFYFCSRVPLFWRTLLQLRRVLFILRKRAYMHIEGIL